MTLQYQAGYKLALMTCIRRPPVGSRRGAVPSMPGWPLQTRSLYIEAELTSTALSGIAASSHCLESCRHENLIGFELMIGTEERWDAIWIPGGPF